MSARMSHPNWPLAERVLIAVLPGAKGFDPDDLPIETWEAFPIEDSGDVEVAARLWQRLGRPTGLLVAVTFASYLRTAGPFFVDGDEIDRVIHAHAGLFEDNFFSGDTCIVEPAAGRVLVIHHDGFLARVHGHPVHFGMATPAA